MILGVDFQFRDDMKQETVPIEILAGPYKGVISRFTKVSVHELEDRTAKVRFEYELYETGDYTKVDLRKDRIFTEFLGLILNTIILASVGDDDEKLVETVG
jgi:hypothetical protein